MDDTHTAPLPLSTTPPAVSVTMPSTGLVALPRWFALVQAIAVCGIPTQIVVVLILAMASGASILDGDGISIQFFATVSLVDTALVALLIRLFLALSGETSAKVFVGRRPVFKELWRGLALVPVVLIAVTGIVLGLRAIAPWTHTVSQSPLESFMRTPLEAAIFMVVVVLAGGVREELQRAFILHRFEQRLGGGRLGLAIFSVTFGALHIDQGLDVAVAIGLLGLLWGILYLKRRSAVLSMANHAGFNAAQVLQVVIVRALGG